MTVNITLVSNACMELYPDNVTAKFRTEFPRLLDFSDSKYEVALTSFQCKKSWNTVNDRHTCGFTFRVTRASRSDLMTSMSDVEFVQLFSIQLPEGCYTGFNQIVETLNRLVDEIGCSSFVSFSFEPISHKTTIHFKEGIESMTAEVVLDEGLCRKLGWNRKGHVGEIAILGENGYSETSPNTSTLDEIDHMFIHCDLARNQHFVGDKETALLQIFSNKGKFGEMLSYEPRNLVWLPIRKEQFRDCLCIITDATGLLVPFESGTSVVRVLIRRTSPF